MLQKYSFDTARLTELLQDLIREGIPVRDFKGIIEMVALYCSSKVRGREDSHVEIGELVEYIRFQRRKQLVASFHSHRNALKAVLLTEATEEWFQGGSEDDGYSAGEEVRARGDDLVARIEGLLNSYRQGAIRNVVILCRSELRSKVGKFLRDFSVVGTTLSFDELDPQMQVEQIGSW